MGEIPVGRLVDLFFPFLEISGWIHAEAGCLFPIRWIKPVYGWSTCGSLAVFPRLKSKKSFISILPFWVFGCVSYTKS
jgi:hypothetical protein